MRVCTALAFGQKLTPDIVLQWAKLASGDKAHAYALTGAGLVGIVRVDCLEQDEPKEGFRCGLSGPGCTDGDVQGLGWRLSQTQLHLINLC